MGLQETNEVDVISYNKSNGVVTLGIIDALDWGNVEENLLFLQEKLNVYLSFIESGKIYSTYEVANGSKFEIKVYFKNSLPQSSYNFLKQVSNIIKGAGYEFSYEVGL